MCIVECPHGENLSGLYVGWGWGALGRQRWYVIIFGFGFNILHMQTGIPLSLANEASKTFYSFVPFSNGGMSAYWTFFNAVYRCWGAVQTGLGRKGRKGYIWK
jgi:hypothetical protein